MPIISYVKKRRINRISEKSLAHKNQLDAEEKFVQQTVRTVKKEEPIPEVQPIKPVGKRREVNQNLALKDVIQESGTLSPFGQVTQRKQKKEDEKDK